MSELSHKDWIVKASAIRFRDRAFIDGKTVAARSGRTFASVNPATGEVLAEVASCGEEDIDLAVAAARRSFNAGVWSRTSPTHRRQVLLRLAQLLRENLHELALLDRSTWANRQDAATVDIPGSAAIFQWSKPSTRSMAKWRRPAKAIWCWCARAAWRDRRGGAVEFPARHGDLEMRTGAGGGQLVVLNPPSNRLCRPCGWRNWRWKRPAGWRAHVVPASAKPPARRLAAIWMWIALPSPFDCRRQDVPAVFRSVEHEAGLAGTGGKSPNLVFADCSDLDAAATWRLSASSQPGRSLFRQLTLLVQRGIKDAFVDKLVKRAAATQPGDPLDPASKMGDG